MGYRSLPSSIPGILNLNGPTLSRSQYEDLKCFKANLEQIIYDYEEVMRSSQNSSQEIQESVRRMLTHRDARKRSGLCTDRSSRSLESHRQSSSLDRVSGLSLVNMEEVSTFVTGKTIDELLQTWDYNIHEKDVVALLRRKKPEIAFLTRSCFGSDSLDRVVSHMCMELSRYLWNTYKINMARLEEISPYEDDEEVCWVVNGIEFETVLPDDCWHEVIGILMQEEGASVVRLRRVCRDLNNAVVTVPKLLLKDHSLSDDAVASVCRSYTGLIELDISCNEGITDEGLRYLGGMESLRRLNLASLNVSGKGVAYLKPLVRLEKLSLRSTDVKGCDLRGVLGGMTGLRELRLCDIEVNSIDLEVLANMRQMEVLDMTNTDIDDDVMKTVVSNMPRLRELYLTGTRVTDDGIAEISHLTKVEQLHLGNTKITSSCCKFLMKMVHLRRLVFFGTKISRTCSEIAKLKAAIPLLNKV